jgi:hypothetical protein
VRTRYLQGDEAVVIPPVAQIRVGSRDSVSALVGLGLLPFAGLGRWYSAYAIGRLRFEGGAEVSVGAMTVLMEQLDQHHGLVADVSIPLTGPFHLGASWLVDPWSHRDAFHDDSTFALRLGFDAERAFAKPKMAPVGFTPMGE